MNELFWSSSEQEREQGYNILGEHYNCLICDYKTEEGYVYPKNEMFVDAKKQMVLHIREEHGSVFSHLIGLDKKVTGISEHQSRIMKLFYEGVSDYDIQQTLNIGSISTVRNHRYVMKEKEKQSKAIVTMMSLLNKASDQKTEIIKPHKTATMLDKRYEVTFEESMKIIEKYFPDGTDAPLKTFSVKEKYKIVILREIIKKFENNIKYKESEVDTILKKIYENDHVQIRRYLIQYGFMDRERDGSAYWVKEEWDSGKVKSNSEDKKKNKLRKKELAQAYKEKVANEDVESGVYQIKNLVSGKIYIGTSRNVKKLNGVIFQLNTGSFMNKALQSDWSRLGEEKFLVEVLEYFVEDEDYVTTMKKIKKLERAWKEKLQPYGDKGYHKKLVK